MSFDVSSPQKARCSRCGKIVESDFTPRTVKLAKHAKVQARTRTAVEDAFPGEAGAAAMLDLSCAVDRCSGPEAPVLHNVFNRLQENVVLQTDVLTFVFYASTGFRGEISGKVNDLNKPITGIPGNLSADQISDSVRWLLKDNNYIFGDLNVQAKTCNCNLPFHSPFIKPVITQVCFGKGKANRDAARTMISHREIPANLYALVGAAIENHLKAWMTGSFNPISFTEEIGCESYLCHRSSFMILQANTPKFTQKVQFTLLKTILCDSGRAHLLDGYLAPDPGHLRGVDYESLEASAGASGDEQE
ncbi:hypothetical protein EV714DRAFT_204507 [Schizophyllum commune]